MTERQWWEDLPVHPVAALAPLLTGSELADLVASIASYGLRQPVVLSTDGSCLLDGRNRLAACKLAGVEPSFRNLDEGDDPVAFIWDSNLSRRHLTPGQAALWRVEIERFSGVQQMTLNGERLPHGGKPYREIAGDIAVSATTIQKARIILTYAPEKARLVLQSSYGFERAYTEANEILEQQRSEARREEVERERQGRARRDKEDKKEKERLRREEVAARAAEDLERLRQSAPELAEMVRQDEISLVDALERKDDQDLLSSPLAMEELRGVAPDLAARVEAGTLGFVEAQRIVAEREQKRHQAHVVATKMFANGLAFLWSVFQRPTEPFIDEWVPEANPHRGTEPLAHLWTADGIREVAQALFNLANAVEEQGGKLAEGSTRNDWRFQGGHEATQSR